MSPPGVRVNKGVFSSTVGILCLSTKFDDMNECDAPESNNTVARVEMTRNSPRTTPCALLALLKYPFYPLFNFDNGMNLISKSLTILT